MTNEKSKEGIMSAEVYADRKGITPNEVISMIKNGDCSGYMIGDQWFVKSSEISGVNTKAIATHRVTRSEYDAARNISMLMSFLGWFVFVIGVIVSLIGVATGLDVRHGGGMFILSLLPGIGIAVSGLFLVAAGQVTKATADIAGYTKEILGLLREKA